MMKAKKPCWAHPLSLPSCASDRIYLLSTVTTSRKLKVRSSSDANVVHRVPHRNVHEVTSELKHAAISSNYRWQRQLAWRWPCHFLAGGPACLSRGSENILHRIPFWLALNLSMMWQLWVWAHQLLLERRQMQLAWPGPLWVQMRCPNGLLLLVVWGSCRG